MVNPDSIPRYAQPVEPADARTCGDCHLCKCAPHGGLCCLRSMLTAESPDDVELEEVEAGWEACEHWRESKWA